MFKILSMKKAKNLDCKELSKVVAGMPYTINNL